MFATDGPRVEGGPGARLYCRGARFGSHAPAGRPPHGHLRGLPQWRHCSPRSTPSSPTTREGSPGARSTTRPGRRPGPAGRRRTPASSMRLGRCRRRSSAAAGVRSRAWHWSPAPSTWKAWSPSRRWPCSCPKPEARRHARDLRHVPRPRRRRRLGEVLRLRRHGHTQAGRRRRCAAAVGRGDGEGRFFGQGRPAHRSLRAGLLRPAGGALPAHRRRGNVLQGRVPAHRRRPRCPTGHAPDRFPRGPHRLRQRAAGISRPSSAAPWRSPPRPAAAEHTASRRADE